MLKGCTFIDLNAHVQIPAVSQEKEKTTVKQSKERIIPTSASLPYREPLFTDEAIEKKKKRRIILKSREKFPSDFFNENKEDHIVPKRQSTSPNNDYERLRPRRANSTSVETTTTLGTPKFRSNMPIFLNSRPFGKANSNNMYTEGTWARIPVEEAEISDLSLNTSGLRPSKYHRSQSLVDPSTMPESSIIHESRIFNESRSQIESKKMYKDLRQGQIVPRNVVRHHSVQKSRPVNSSGLHHPLHAIQLKPEVIYSCNQDPDIKDNISISTDVSSKVPSREAPSNRGKTIESPQIHYERKIRSRTPDKSLLHLPVIKKEVIKNNTEAVNHYVGNESQARYQHDQVFYCPPSLPLKTTEDQIKRAQSQGNRHGEGKRGKSLNRGSPFIRGKEDLFVGQKVFSAKSIIQFQNLLGRPINVPIQLQNIGKENSTLKPVEIKEVKEYKDHKATKIRGNSSSENKEIKEIENITKETHENERGEFDDSKLTKEPRDLYEFSFSKNFYKDKPSSAIPINTTTFENEASERDQLSIFKGSISSEKQYLKTKGKNFVNSDVKKKFSLLRMKQTQG